MRKQTALLAATVAIAVAVACSSGARLPRRPQGEAVLEVRGAVKRGPFRLGRGDLERLPRRTVRGEDPVTGRRASWEGTSLAALVIERVELTRGADVALVRTADRRAVPVPLALVRQLRPVLADHADGEPLRERVLAWPTEEQRGLRTDPRAQLWWARDVVALELVNGASTLGRALAVPPGAPPGSRLGADLFGARCIACHRVRAAGGENGPDLTRLTERMSEDAFGERMRGHPGWRDRGAEPGEASPQQVWAFLRSVDAVARGSAPPEEPPPADRRERKREPGSGLGPDEDEPDR